MKKNPLITGTLLLTAAGFLSRILGFFYRIFLSRTIGAEGLGIYQMIFPIHGIAFALCAGPIQTSISRLAAANVKKGRSTFRAGLAISLTISVILMIAIRFSAPFLAEHVLLEPQCAPLLPIMALSIPFSAIHACICGYYYGMKKTAVPALSQLLEQFIRIGAVLLIANVAATNGKTISVSLAVWGMLIGEAASAIFSFLYYTFTTDDRRGSRTSQPAYSFLSLAAPLMAMALPLMGNRLILGCLQSLEAIFVPNKLLDFGLSNAEALSTYGVLTGMALPFIFFRQLSPIPLRSFCCPLSQKHRQPAMREKLNARLPWRSVTACIWESSASESLLFSETALESASTITKMPEPLSRSWHGSVPSCICQPRWEAS